MTYGVGGFSSQTKPYEIFISCPRHHLIFQNDTVKFLFFVICTPFYTKQVTLFTKNVISLKKTA